MAHLETLLELCWPIWVAFSASFWKDFLVEVLPRKGHPGDADDASYSLDFCRGRRLGAASQ